MSLKRICKNNNILFNKEKNIKENFSVLDITLHTGKHIRFVLILLILDILLLEMENMVTIKSIKSLVIKLNNYVVTL